MKLTNNKVTKMKLLVPATGLVSTTCWPKGSIENPQITQATAKVIGGSSQTDSKVLSLRTMSTQLTKQGKVELSI